MLDRFRIQENISEEKYKILSSKKLSKSIAVLPFIDLSPKKDQEYFSDGLTEELLNLLVNIDSFKNYSMLRVVWSKNRNGV